MGWLSAILPLLAAGATASPCEPVAGWDRLLAAPGKRYIVVGEMHGTEQAPELFGDLACLTGQARPLVIALELPDADQDELDAYLASDGGEAAQPALLKARHCSAQDGRSSRAMFALIERLRQLHQAGMVEAVVAFVPTTPPAEGYTPQWYERAMAETIMRRVSGQASALVLVGDSHARTGEMTFNGQSYLAMSAHFPERERVTLVIGGHGGRSWSCSRGSAGGELECRAHDFPPTAGASPARGLVLGPAWGVPTGVLHVGGPFTASPPQIRPPFQTTRPTTSTSAIATSTGS